MTEENELDTTVEEWKNAIEEMYYPNDPGFTRRELQDKLNVTYWAVTKILEQMLSEGRCIRGKGTRIDSVGRKQAIPVYQLITKGAKNANF